MEVGASFDSVMSCHNQQQCLPCYLSYFYKLNRGIKPHISFFTGATQIIVSASTMPML